MRQTFFAKIVMNNCLISNVQSDEKRHILWMKYPEKTRMEDESQEKS